MSAGWMGAAACAALAWGCGHEVSPTRTYDNGGSIPSPENFTAVAEFGRVNLTWDAPPGVFSIIDGWFLDRAFGPSLGALEPFVRLNETPHQDQIYVDTHVEDGYYYVYRIRAVTPAGILSEPATTLVQVDLTPPLPPPGLAAVQDRRDGQPFVRVSWESPPGEAYPTYLLFRLPPFPNFGSVDTPFNAFEDFAVEPLITFRYWVIAVDEAKNQSDPTPVVSIQVQP